MITLTKTQRLFLYLLSKGDLDPERLRCDTLHKLTSNGLAKLKWHTPGCYSGLDARFPSECKLQITPEGRKFLGQKS